jgi:lipopolysaccharide export system protein LptC
MSGWRRRSRVVRQFRRFLPIAIGVVLLGLLFAVVGATLVGGDAAEETDQTTIRMVNPRFLGRDEAGQAFVLSAREAARITGAGSRVRLTAPVMVLDREGPRPTRITADTGVYDEVGEVLHLRRKVELDGPAGRFLTEDAVVDTRGRSIVGSAPIQGVGPTGRIAADAYALYDGGARVTFTGNVRARLGQEPVAAPTTAPQGERR